MTYCLDASKFQLRLNSNSHLAGNGVGHKSAGNIEAKEINLLETLARILDGEQAMRIRGGL